MPWGWLILAILSDGQASLERIYCSIEETHDDIKAGEGTLVVNPSLFEEDPKYGNRPKYTHAVRSYLSKFKKAGWVEHVDRGIYRLTEAGEGRLKWYNEKY